MCCRRQHTHCTQPTHLFVTQNPAWLRYWKALLLYLRFFCCARVHAVRSPAAVCILSGPTVVAENTQHLRQALPGFVEDFQLQEALARCEVILCAGEATGIGQATGATTM